MLEACGLHKRWGTRTALAGFSLSVGAGEICGLLGHNGAGKTTFARICAGLERPDSGRVLVDGVDVRSRAAGARASVGLAPQETALYPVATVRENLRFFGALAGLRRRVLRAEIDEVAEVLMLTEVLDRTVATLSGGQQRRTQTATALLHRPAVLLLDEPTVGADPVTRQALLDVVRDRAAQGAAICYTTHYMPELEQLDATVAVTQAGRVIARGGRAQLLAGLPSRVLLGFTGGPPSALAAEAHDVGDDGALRFISDHPAETLTGILAALGEHIERVERVEIREPSLDDLYRQLTGREAENEYVRH